MTYDVLIIGAGVTGCAVARELSRYELGVAVLEREEDVCAGTSKANSAVVHAGFDAKSGTLKAKLNVEGNRMMDKLSEELDIPFERNGSLVICTDREKLSELDTLYQRGVDNGVPELKLLDGEQAHKLEPNLSDDVVGALYAPTGGIICPFILNIAMAENAYENGVRFFFNSNVINIKKEDDLWSVITEKEEYKTRYVVNAAGVYADIFHNMVSKNKIKITPRRGEYMLLDKEMGEHVSKTVFSLPTKLGKGILITPTIHGNLLVGPTAEDVDDKELTKTSLKGISELNDKAQNSVKDLPLGGKVITGFAGLRAHEDGGEFIIREAEDAPAFIDCAGIESPGLTASPAIGRMVKDIIVEKTSVKIKDNYIEKRTRIVNPSKLSLEEKNKLIKENPAYGQIVCRCESVTEGEIIDAIRRPLGAKSLDGVKRRVRAGMGRCQAGFCSPRVMEIIGRELGIPMEKITKRGAGSVMIKSALGTGGETGDE